MVDEVEDTRFLDENALEDIIEEIPALVSLREFADRIEHVRWFQNIGMAADPHLKACARSYLDALGFPHIETAFIHDWEDAEAAAQSHDWDSAGWEAEEQLRSGLAVEALALMDEEALSVALAHVRARAGAALQEISQDIAAIWDVEDEALMNAAVGAATQACHQRALALTAGAPGDHPFVLKYQIFETGHWPIGIAGSSLNLF